MEQGQDDYKGPVTWGGHDPMAWAAAGIGILFGGALTSYAFTSWGVVAPAALASAAGAIALLGVWRRRRLQQ